MNSSPAQAASTCDWRWLAAAAILSLCCLPIWLSVATPNGDLRGHWTDHLRHAGEAMAFEQRGLGLYTRTYDEATSGVVLPCPDHAGLWGQTGTPYPPLGVLLHWPIARLERAGVFAPATAHRLLVWLFGAVSLCCAGLGAGLLSGARRGLFLLLFAPLLVGAGFSGFYDPLWVFAAILAIGTTSRAAAVIAYLLHFRGVVALSFVKWRHLPTIVAVALNSVVAVVASLHLGVFEVHSQLHFTRAAAWWFPPATLLVWWFVRREAAIAGPLVVTAALLFFDRQAAFWHLLVLVPLAVSTLRSGSTRAVTLVTGWMLITAQAFLDTWVPFPFAWLR